MLKIQYRAGNPGSFGWWELSERFANTHRAAIASCNLVIGGAAVRVVPADEPLPTEYSPAETLEPTPFAIAMMHQLRGVAHLLTDDVLDS